MRNYRKGLYPQHHQTIDDFLDIHGKLMDTLGNMQGYYEDMNKKYKNKES